MRVFTTSKSWFPLVLAAVAVPALAACGDDGDSALGPDGDISLPETATAVEEIIDDFLVENEAVESIAGLSSAMAAGCGTSAVTLVDVARAVQTMGYGQASAAEKGKAVREAAGVTATASSLPSRCVGETLVLNPETGVYEPGSGSGPADGIRFVLYQVDSSGQPVSPLTEIGHVDIIDNSTSSTLAGSIEAVVDDNTLVELSGSITTGETTATLDAGGFFSDGVDRMDVSLDANLTDSDTEADISADAELSAPDLLITTSLDASADLNAETVDGSLDTRLEHGGNRVDFSATFDETEIDGEVRLDGSLVATFSVSPQTDAIQLTDASGGELSQQDLAALEDMFEASTDAVEPIGQVAGLLLALSGGF